MQDDYSSNLKSVSRDLARMASKFMDYSVRGKTRDSMATTQDVELNLKVFGSVNAWYDKTVNQTGNLAGLVDSLTEKDKDYLIELKSLEQTEQKKYK